MKGRLSYEKWAVTSTGGDFYLAERKTDQGWERQELKAHCLACAKTEVLSERGGAVDLRGWHMQGHCGSFLKAMQTAVDEEAA